MNLAAADQVAKAVLYEGYMLYPYRPSAVKNQQRFNFGVVYPEAFSHLQSGLDPWTMQANCLVQGTNHSRLEVRVRFLQLVERTVEEALFSGTGAQTAEFRRVQKLTVADRTFYSWQEAVEQDLEIVGAELSTLLHTPTMLSFRLGASTSEEALCDTTGTTVGRIVRTRREMNGRIRVAAHRLAEGTFRIEVRIENVTAIDEVASASRDLALTHSLVSAHIVLGIEHGDFVSLLDPPEALKSAAEDCHNQGVFPVLVGSPGQRDTVLASPIILYDYPQIAPESAGDLFDGTEIDEILSLRIMTMTDDEKHEMRESDERARQMLERTESLPAEQFMKLHGVLRGLRSASGETR